MKMRFGVTVVLFGMILLPIRAGSYQINALIPNYVRLAEALTGLLDFCNELETSEGNREKLRQKIPEVARAELKSLQAKANGFLTLGIKIPKEELERMKVTEEEAKQALRRYREVYKTFESKYPAS